jgi:anti-anti-sigma factor
VTTEEQAKICEIDGYVADHNGREHFLLDFTGIDLVSSEFLVALIRLRHRLQAAGKRLTLCNLGTSVAEVFAVTGLGQFFEIRADEPHRHPSGCLGSAGNAEKQLPSQAGSV